MTVEIFQVANHTIKKVAEQSLHTLGIIVIVEATTKNSHPNKIKGPVENP